MLSCAAVFGAFHLWLHLLLMATLVFTVILSTILNEQTETQGKLERVNSRGRM